MKKIPVCSISLIFPWTSATFAPLTPRNWRRISVIARSFARLDKMRNYSAVKSDAPDWKKISLRLCLRETGFSRHNGVLIKALLEPLNTTLLCWFEGFQGGPQLVLHDAEMPVSLKVFSVWFWVHWGMTRRFVRTTRWGKINDQLRGKNHDQQKKKFTGKKNPIEGPH